MTRVVSMLALLFLAFAPAAEAWLPADPLADPAFEEILALENGRDAGPRLAELARDRSPVVRARAVRALARAQDATRLPLLRDLLKDREPAVRHEAALAIGLLWDQGDDTALIEAFGTEQDPVVRDALVEAIGRCGSVERGVPFLAGLVSGADASLIHRACLGLGICGYRKVGIQGTEEALDVAVRSPDPAVRWAAAYALFRGLPERAHRHVQPLLQDPDPLVRIYAIRALGAGKRRQLADPLAHMIRDPDWRVRVEALRALPLVKGYSFVSLMGLAVEDPVPLVQITALEALGQIEANQALTYIEPIILEAEDWRLRAAAIVAKTRLVGDGALPMLQQLKESSEWQIRRAAAEALGLLQSNHGRTFLSEMTADKNAQVLATVAASLRDYPQVMALTDLQYTLHSDDLAVLTNAASALGQRGDRTAITPLTEAYGRLKSPSDLEPMVEILKALGNILAPPDTHLVNGALTPEGKALALATLEQALKDPDRNVALAAADALKRVDGRDRAAEIAAASTGTFPLYLDEIKAPRRGRRASSPGGETSSSNSCPAPPPTRWPTSCTWRAWAISTVSPSTGWCPIS